MPFSGCLRPSLLTRAAKRSRSSARSIASGEVPRIGMPRLLERRGELERSLAAELDDHPDQLAARLLDMEDLEHVLDRQRLEIEPVGRVVVGRDGLRVAVDHDRLEAGLGERVGGVAAAIIELDPLADPVGPAAEDDDLAPVGGLALVLGLAEARRLVGRVHVGRLRLELGGAGVDPLEDRADSELVAKRPHLVLGGGADQHPW